ncbi:hypothetical protein Ais01nite_35640 [Asanoa ishikariensis]|uniref:Actin-binding WH2 domain-containing protein n=1 Tax=Asanoa ishikariensis TaxID=137265 RepID=A0A1H3LJV1_9ACTN|nr:hypothetical protein [Asanoa ishikariensis]GIF65529.1 hypothetical protein Ais01nite_35640 [Asanoa ishikariensis]SDY64616.1 hypothetical protein SAMN05421684_0803 [Asanoa ishikariensis]
MPANSPGLLIIERILRDRGSIWQQIVDERDLNRLSVQMLASSAVALAIYGAVLGAFHSPLMALTSAVKLPLLFLVTLAICLPTLYLFNLVFGARLSVRQSVSLVMVAVTVTAMLALAFAPISLFFRITAADYSFFKLLNVAILALSAIVGLRFLTGGMQILHAHGLLSPAKPAEPAPVAEKPAPAALPAEEKTPVTVGAPIANGDGTAAAAAPAPALPVLVAPPAGQHHVWNPALQRYQLARPAGVATERPASMTLLYIWILLFGFVGTQLAWTLRPFFGNPDSPFALFREIEGNFYAEIIRTIANL